LDATLEKWLLRELVAIVANYAVEPRVIVFGGSNDKKSSVGLPVEAYDADADAWCSCPAFPTKVLIDPATIVGGFYSASHTTVITLVTFKFDLNKTQWTVTLWKGKHTNPNSWTDTLLRMPVYDRMIHHDQPWAVVDQHNCYVAPCDNEFLEFVIAQPTIYYRRPLPAFYVRSTRAVLLNGRLVFTGYQTWWRYRINPWAKVGDIATPSRPINGQTATIVPCEARGLLYIVGGDFIATRGLLIWDATTDRWIQGPRMRYDRFRAAAVLLADRWLLVCGGVMDNIAYPLACAELLDLGDIEPGWHDLPNGWQSIANLQHPRYNHSAIVTFP
jgi:hypothetical protein